MFRTSNPAFNQPAFAPPGWGGAQSERRFGDELSAPAAAGASGTMTVRGTIAKTGVLFLLTLAAAAGTWSGIERGTVPAWSMWAGMGAGALLSIVLFFWTRAASVLSPLYAIAQGVFLGGLSLFIAERAGPQGGMLVGQAVGITFGIFAGMLLAYGTGLIRLGSTAKKVILVATLGVGILYLVNIVMRIGGWGSIPMIHQGGVLGIGFSLFVIGLAALNLVWDFQNVDEGARNGAPRHMEWYCGFALLATMVWLYIEVLRLLMKLRSSQ